MAHWLPALHTLLDLELRHELQEDVEGKGESHGRGGAETLTHFVSSPYRKQLAAGSHFRHEHPATALSWKDPVIAALGRHPLVHCVVADQCQYGLTSHVSNKEGKRLPALKPA